MLGYSNNKDMTKLLGKERTQGEEQKKVFVRFLPLQKEFNRFDIMYSHRARVMGAVSCVGAVLLVDPSVEHCFPKDKPRRLCSDLWLLGFALECSQHGTMYRFRCKDLTGPRLEESQARN